MILQNEVQISFGDGLDFVVQTPCDEELDTLFSASQELYKQAAVSFTSFGVMADIIRPKVMKYPEKWETFAPASQTRLLFEIAKYLLNEALTIPEIKKKA